MFGNIGERRPYSGSTKVRGLQRSPNGCGCIAIRLMPGLTGIDSVGGSAYRFGEWMARAPATRGGWLSGSNGAW
jgi:hypothetical protein